MLSLKMKINRSSRNFLYIHTLEKNFPTFKLVCLIFEKITSRYDYCDHSDGCVVGVSRVVVYCFYFLNALLMEFDQSCWTLYIFASHFVGSSNIPVHNGLFYFELSLVSTISIQIPFKYNYCAPLISVWSLCRLSRHISLSYFLPS